MVIKHAPRPIVAVPEKLLDGRGIVVAYDGKSQAARAIQVLAATGICLDTKIWVLGVSKSEGEASKSIERAVEFFKLHDIEATPIRVAKKQATYKTITLASVSSSQRSKKDRLWQTQTTVFVEVHNLFTQ